jgi:phospholipid/cholesterol/gamma-HCH transport system substrate-binding protein
VVADLKALAPVLAQLQAAGNDLPGVLETVLSFPFPDKVLDAVKGDYVNLDVLVDLSPLTLLNNVVGSDGQPSTDPGLISPSPTGTPTPTTGGKSLGSLLGALLGPIIGGSR